ncbi:MAG: response regulator [Deltaproteobacteria bacterium]|nr:response regulator [Deltaproteobacteria bacterium]
MAEEITKILITDDDPDVRELLMEAVLSWGYQAAVAKDGEEALARLRMEKFNIVITDLMMPRMDGMALLQRINELDAEIQVVMITGYATIETALKAIQSGAYDYIAKPFRLDELMVVIKKACEWRRIISQNKELLNELRAAYAEIIQLKANIGESQPVAASAPGAVRDALNAVSFSRDSADIYKQQEYIREADRLIKNKFALKA